MSKTLEGKVALVTGGSRGIGAAIAKRLAEDGASVALTYSSSPGKANEVVQAIEAAGGKAVAIQADSAQEEAIRRAVTETVEKLGRLDILVNNAGILIRETVENFSIADFDRMVAVNVRAPFIGAQEAAKHLGEGGRIITIGSMVADVASFPGISVYGMTKAAVAGLTRGLARDLGPRGITVNNVQPGPTNTDMNPADGPASEVLIPRLAIDRYGKDSEIASLVSYLAGPEAAFITGASLTIDGGLTA